MAPLFTAKDIDNNTIKLAEVYKEKTVLMVFWGTWCGACIQEVPLFKEFRERNSKDKFEMLSVHRKIRPGK